ncbi:Polygalacturonate 4-alpha-galacturonosyltransferase [Thalictrum thalictroides]|uniref:Hexosyltransferase n=1 Tax=Thalictrum thalictroides TaxID=46969 RepID=A0A7J6V0I0_THATH|nr:Polygalacturonate 4-alpha-galacturonosyltransferase [Thalictrum thalictroides]
MKMRKRMLPVLMLLLFTVVAPLVLYTDTLASFITSSSSKSDFIEDVSSFQSFGGGGEKITQLNLLPQESINTLKEPIGVVYSDNSTNSIVDSAQTEELPLAESTEHITRVLSATNDEIQSDKENPIKQVITDENEKDSLHKTISVEQVTNDADGKDKSSLSQDVSNNDAINMRTVTNKRSAQTSGNGGREEPMKNNIEKPSDQIVVQDARVRHLKDQLIRARVYISLGATRNNPHFIKELRLRMKEVQRAIGDASKDSELPRNAYDKLKAMEQTLAKGKQIQDDCTAVVKKLRAILHSTEEQLRVHKKQTMFLTQLAAKTLPKGLHCLPLRLSTEYYSLNSSQQQFPNQERLEDPKLYHYALFSDNVLAAAAVVNSTVSHAQEQENHVFHIVTDRLNYAAMRMWFLANPPGKAAIQVQNIEELTWLNSSYSPVLKQLGSPSMIDYYFKAHRGNSDSNLKFRNPKYLSILNHIRFYLPEIFPKLDKVLFLDDDVVVQKDLTGLWSVDLKGKVNGAVETCREGFHRFDRYLNFSNPLISKNFDPHACGWAYGMNIFDLEEWKKQNITEVYHSWQKLNNDRQLWKLGTLPPGLITFWKQTIALDRSWHVLGLGYNPSINQKEIERAAVIHYNGNMKSWLEIGIPKYKGHWTKFVDYDQVYLRECNINP